MKDKIKSLNFPAGVIGKATVKTEKKKPAGTFIPNGCYISNQGVSPDQGIRYSIATKQLGRVP